jgi:DNA-binding response OmpR family regulator
MSSTPDRGSLAGLRVLVVEDDFDVAESLRRALTSLGCQVVGPASTAEEARNLARTEALDAALLDVALSPGTSAPVARALRSRSCPLVFVTGYSNLDLLPQELRGLPILMKPVDPDDLQQMLHELVREPARRDQD